MEGVIINYRVKYTKEVVILIPEIKSRHEAAKLIGKKVIWKDKNGKEYIGKVTAPHGNTGAIRAKFSIPLPAKALGKIVKIENNSK